MSSHHTLHIVQTQGAEIPEFGCSDLDQAYVVCSSTANREKKVELTSSGKYPRANPKISKQPHVAEI